MISIEGYFFFIIIIYLVGRYPQAIADHVEVKALCRPESESMCCKVRPPEEKNDFFRALPKLPLPPPPP